MTNHENIRPMFDTHHANIEEKDFKSSLISMKGSLRHFHISENDRGAPGDGHIPWEEIFSILSEIEYSEWLTIEAFSRNDESFAKSINVWREFSDPWDIAKKGLSLIKLMQTKFLL